MADKDSIATLRREYVRGELTESSLHRAPLEQFSAWFSDAVTHETNEPNACALATVSSSQSPSVRMVLIKSFDARGFVFYSNYESTKGVQLRENPKCAVVFYWPVLERQVRIEGVVAPTSAEESDTYFHSRPRVAQLGAAVSLQSRKLASREEMEERVSSLSASLEDNQIQRPPTWGGFRITPNRFEFWQGRENRLHDRIAYELVNGLWSTSSLWP